MPHQNLVISTIAINVLFFKQKFCSGIEKLQSTCPLLLGETIVYDGIDQSLSQEISQARPFAEYPCK